MASRPASTIIKLVIASLLVGLALSFLDLDPQALLAGLGETALKVFEIAVRIVEWSAKFIILGAAVVIPIWLVVIGWRYFRGRTG
jgi:hypothetical protein